MIELHLYQSRAEPSLRHHCLGPRVSIETLRQSAKKMIQDVTRECGAGRLTRELIQVKGTVLGSLVLGSEGQHILSTLLAADAECIIFSDDDELLIPWEWLRPTPRLGERHVPTIGERWRTTRFTQYPVMAMIAKDRDQEERSAGRLCTIGLGLDPQRPWRLLTPRDADAFAAVCELHDVIHIVGHYDEKERVVRVRAADDTELWVSCETAVAMPFCDHRHTVIISACGLAQLDRTLNIAQAVAEAHRAIAWTPMVSITEAQAKAVDDILAESVLHMTTVSPLRIGELFRIERVSGTLGPLASVYVGFGL